jgi:ankyrin repeat protein
MEPTELKHHLEATRERFDVTTIFDRTGYSPLHFAAYKNSDKLCEILCEFVLNPSPDESEENDEETKHQKQQLLRDWIN